MPHIDITVMLWVWNKNEGDVEKAFRVCGTITAPQPGNCRQPDDPGDATYAIIDESGQVDPPYLTQEHYDQIHEAVLAHLA